MKVRYDFEHWRMDQLSELYEEACDALLEEGNENPTDREIENKIEAINDDRAEAMFEYLMERENG